MIKVPCEFSYDHYKEIIESAKTKYKILPLRDYRPSTQDKVLLLRHDIDAKVRRATRMARLEYDLDVKATYFVRVHAELYNPFGFRAYPLLKRIAEMGHEIGLHFENLDFSHITGEDPSSVLRREIGVLETVLGVKIQGIAGHRGFSGIDNSDFIPKTRLADFGVEYEAHELTTDCFFVSDSLRRWARTDGRCACQILQENHPRLCLLTHPQFWYRRAYYLG